jgi:hypothetical protein
VLLEADLIRGDLGKLPHTPGQRVVQIYRRGDIGEPAAHSLRSKSAAQGLDWVDLPLAGARASGDVRKALATVRAGDVVVCCPKRWGMRLAIWCPTT